MNIYSQRIHNLQQVMIKKKITYFYLHSDDDHLSEYVSSHYQGRAFLSGFTGSAGFMIISQNNCYLWVDGRYFIQGEEETKDTDLTLFKMGQKDVPTIKEFLISNLNEGATLAFSFNTISVKDGNMFLKIANNKKAHILNEDLLDEIWSERPPLISKKAHFLSEALVGESLKSKLNKLQSYLKDNHYDVMILNALDDINYLFNIRGEDVKYSPVLLSNALIYQDKAILYLFKDSLNEEFKKYLDDNNITLKNYNEIYENITFNHLHVVIDDSKVNFALYNLAKENNILHLEASFIEAQKAIKNDVELANMKSTHVKDGVAVFKLISYLKHSKDKKDELSITNKLEEYRKEQEGYLYPSFATICAFKEHGAIVHYEADEKTNIPVTSNSFLLLDSGGQYVGGTTDITRTIVLGKVTKQMKKHFTLALKSHLKLLNATYPLGASGANIDVYARSVLWKENLDYMHGTGHGVGYMLNVHEGPCGFSYASKTYGKTILKPGMVISDEPGLYFQGKYGIRHESLIYIAKKDDDFLMHKVLTMVPFDLEGIDKKYLDKEDVISLNNYHREVYKTLSPYLSDNDKKYLRKCTRKI